MASGGGIVIRLADAKRIGLSRHRFGAPLDSDVLIAEEGFHAEPDDKAGKDEQPARAEEGLSVSVVKHVRTIHRSARGRKSAQQDTDRANNAERIEHSVQRQKACGDDRAGDGVVTGPAFKKHRSYPWILN